jgi:hypothetical protein
MALVFLTSQFAVELTVIVIFIMTVALALVITKRYFEKKGKSLLYWSLGIWCFVIGVFLEILFAAGVYSTLLIIFYLFIVGVLVETLALGSIQFVKSKKIRYAYYVFVLASTILLLYSLIIPSSTLFLGNETNVITYWIVYGNLPLLILVTSSLVTVPAAVILVVIAGKSYLQRKNPKLLSIIVGVVIVSVAGSLYIVQYPAFLYISEFIGILLLWYGFI